MKKLALIAVIALMMGACQSNNKTEATDTDQNAAANNKKTLDGVKILGNGDLSKKLTVQAQKFTAGAKEKIEAAGGKAEVI